VTYYFRLAAFRFREPWTDLRASLASYALFAFFVILLTEVWQRFQSGHSLFAKGEIVLYVGVTETLFMTFLRMKNIQTGMEDFAIFLAKPRSWIGREFFGNIGSALGARLAYVATLLLLTFAVELYGIHIPVALPGFLLRLAFLLVFLAVPQALLTALLSSFKLSFPQTDYFVLPFSKLFLSFGGVFAPLSDFGEPLRSIFLRLPGSDLFFQPAYFAVRGECYSMSVGTWILRVLVIDAALFVALLIAFRRGKRNFQAWGG
jgi:hypothetical protein